MIFKKGKQMSKNLKEAHQKAGTEEYKQQNKPDICLEIRQYLEANGITQSFLNKKTGIGTTKISLALKGKRRLTLDEYSYICWALDVNTDKFLKPKPPGEGR